MVKKIFIIIFIVVLVVSMFFIRLGNFRNNILRTTDEVIYVGLGVEFTKNHSHYNTIGYYRRLNKEGKELPDYFAKPLFKHPPLFPFLISLSFRLFGFFDAVAVYIPLLFGVMMIPLIFWLATLLFSRLTGLIAALLLAIDPIHTLCSQKIWMETVLSFFTLLSICFFVKALKSKQDFYFILSGLAVGLGAVTKYPALLSTIIVVFYAVVFDRRLFSRKMFLWGLGMPFIVLLPWLAWNLSVYGIGFVPLQIESHFETDFLRKAFLLSISVLCLVVMICAVWKLWKKIKEEKSLKLNIGQEKTAIFLTKIFFSFIGIVLFILIREEIRGSLRLNSFPVLSLYNRVFSEEPFWFYFGRLVEFSFVYFFAFLSCLMFRREGRKEGWIVQISVFVILFFYTLWGNYQSRYILAAIPFLLILASDILVRIKEKVSSISVLWLRYLLKSVIVLFLFNILLKNTFIYLFVCKPNQVVYF